MSDASWKAFDVTVADHVAEVTLVGPGKGNTMGPDFWRELPEVFGGLDADDAVRAVVLTGAGKHFSFFPDPEAVLAAARATAAEIAANPPLVVQGVKTVLDHTRNASVEDSLRFVAAWNSAFMPSDDLTEAITALFEKRPPNFTGA